jgi:glycosyltransferase involved in cell wall biosynthesis
LGFAQVDLDLLRRHHDVTVVVYPDRPTLRFVRDMWHAASRVEAGYTFFAAEHALLAGLILRTRGKGLVVAVGGYDTACDRTHGYGLAAQGHAWLPRAVARLATRLVPHSAYAMAELARLSPSGARKARWSYLGIDVASWSSPGVDRTKGRVVTVARVTRQSFRRKGIDRFIDLARLDPRREYVLAGQVDDELLSSPLMARLPGNLLLAGALDHTRLCELYWSADTYAQLSWHETFGAAVAEAMACGCVPLVSDQAALLETTGGLGIIVPGGSAAEAKEALDHASATPDREALRRFVARSFSLDQRSAALEAAIAESVGRGDERRRESDQHDARGR